MLNEILDVFGYNKHKNPNKPIAIARISKERFAPSDFCWPIFSRNKINDIINSMKILEIQGIV